MPLRLNVIRRSRAILLVFMMIVIISDAADIAHAASHRSSSHRRAAHAQRRSRLAGQHTVQRSIVAHRTRSHHGRLNQVAYAFAGARSRRNHHPVHRLRTSNQSVGELIPLIPRVGYVPALKGSRESLVRQNVISTAEGLDRIENDSQLEQMVAGNSLVDLPAGSGLHINNAMPLNRRYCRPWTAQFLSDLARVHSQRFRNALIVTSAVRTAEYQRHLLRTNGNAAPAEGDLASPHLTGATVDIAKKGLSMAEIGWLRAYLLPLQTSGKVDVEEEFRQSCFHITVYNGYLPPETVPDVHMAPSRRRGRRSAMLAARLH